MSVKGYQGQLDGSEMNIGIVVSRFNEYAGKELYAACLEELKRLGVAEEDITYVTVPGALEIPFALQTMADSNQYQALIALGAVIRGETYHFEIVSDRSSEGIARVTADYGIPVANGVLTCENDEQCKARTHMKGKDCARCAVEMVNLQASLLSDLYQDEEWEDDDDDDADDIDFEEKGHRHDGKC